MSSFTRSDLIDVVQSAAGISKPAAKGVVDAVFDKVWERLLEGDIVKLAGLCTLSTKQQDARTHRNPHTGDKVVIGPKRVVRVRLSQKLQDAVAEVS